jgi:hypothetical protein
MTIKKVITLLTLALLLASIVALSLKRIYRIRANANAELLWNKDEGYLFLVTTRWGYRLSYLQYFGNLVREELGGTTHASDERHTTEVMKITPTEIQHFKSDNIGLNLFTPVGEAIYANHQGELWKWKENHFEQVNAEENEVFQTSGQQLKVSFTDINGWSKQFGIFSRQTGESEFPMDIGDKHMLLVAKVGPNARDVSVSLQHSSTSAQEMWHLDQKTRTTSKKNYESVFGASQGRL